jgi:hypothetical protein
MYIEIKSMLSNKSTITCLLRNWKKLFSYYHTLYIIIEIKIILRDGISKLIIESIKDAFKAKNFILILLNICTKVIPLFDEFMQIS